jgi:hypothetical protein
MHFARQAYILRVASAHGMQPTEFRAHHFVGSYYHWQSNTFLMGQE